MDNLATTFKNFITPSTGKFTQDVTGQIHSTYDYDRFIKMPGNRDINWPHVKKLVASMRNKYIPVPALVTKDMELIDGQHRREACRILELPLHFTVIDGGLSDVHNLNQTVQKWKPSDFLDGYCDMGMQDYIIYKDFVAKYKFSHHEAMSILAGTVVKAEQFNSGAFKVGDLATATAIADGLTSIGELYSGYKRRSFVLAILDLLKKTAFDIEIFNQKLRMQQTKMVDCTTKEEYITLIKKIYNYYNVKKI